MFRDTLKRLFIAIILVFAQSSVLLADDVDEAPRKNRFARVIGGLLTRVVSVKSAEICLFRDSISVSDPSLTANQNVAYLRMVQDKKLLSDISSGALGAWIQYGTKIRKPDHYKAIGVVKIRGPDIAIDIYLGDRFLLIERDNTGKVSFVDEFYSWHLAAALHEALDEGGRRRVSPEIFRKLSFAESIASQKKAFEADRFRDEQLGMNFSKGNRLVASETRNSEFKVINYNYQFAQYKRMVRSGVNEIELQLYDGDDRKKVSFRTTRTDSITLGRINRALSEALFPAPCDSISPTIATRVRIGMLLLKGRGEVIPIYVGQRFYLLPSSDSWPEFVSWPLAACLHEICCSESENGKGLSKSEFEGLAGDYSIFSK